MRVTPFTENGAAIERVALLVVDESVALIVAVVFLATNPVWTVKVALVDPLSTFTDSGTVASELLLAILMVTPLDGAGLVMVTVAVELAPPVIDIGDNEMLSSV